VADPWDGLAIAPLAKKHQRSTFACGKSEIDDFLKKHARQNDDKGISKTFALTEQSAPDVVVGYYSVRFGQVSCEQLPEAELKGLPRYPVPTFHLARMGVDKAFKDRNPAKRAGELLLFHSFRKAVRMADEAGLFAYDVIAVDEDAAGFYRKYQFQPLLDQPLHMFLPLTTLRKLV